MNLDARLTRTEKEIARMYATGMSKKEIAYKRNLSELTVQNHLANIYRKVEVQKTSELCVWWFCTTFRINLERVVGVVLLGLFLFYEAQVNRMDFIRNDRRTEAVRNERRAAGRRTEWEQEFEC